MFEISKSNHPRSSGDQIHCSFPSHQKDNELAGIYEKKLSILKASYSWCTNRNTFSSMNNGAGCDFIISLRCRPCSSKQSQPMKQIKIPFHHGSCDFLEKDCASQQAGLFLNVWKVRDSWKRTGAIYSKWAILLGVWTSNKHLQPYAHLATSWCSQKVSRTPSLLSCVGSTALAGSCKLTRFLQFLSPLMKIKLSWRQLWNPSPDTVSHSVGPTKPLQTPWTSDPGSTSQSQSTASDHTWMMLALLQEHLLGPEACQGPLSVWKAGPAAGDAAGQGMALSALVCGAAPKAWGSRDTSRREAGDFLPLCELHPAPEEEPW